MNLDYDIPEGWKRHRLRFDVKVNPMKSKLDLPPDTEVSFVPMDAVGERGGIRQSESRPLDEVYDGYTYFADDDVCVAKITPCFENGKGALARDLTNGIAFGTTELHVLRSLDDLDARFLFYLTQSHDFRSYGEAEMLGAGGQKRVPEDFLKDWRPPLPPLAVQQRIARFLDAETARIDALVAKKQALLDRLAEKRQALITRAVTRGLDPDAPRTPSGIEWLGEIPAHWEVWKLAHAYPQIGSGTTPASGDETYYDSDKGTPWITTSELRENRIEETSAFVTTKALGDYSALRVYDPGSIFIAMYGATIGRLGISTVEATCNQACCVFEASERFDNTFLFYWLWHRRADLISMAVGGGQPNLSQEVLREERALRPPLEEQQAIAQHLDRIINETREIADRVKQSIARLQEYRAALVTAAVTGQIDHLR